MKTLDVNAKGQDAPPSWLVVTDEGVTITLSRPTPIRDIKVEELHLRTPTVRDLRICQKNHPNDELAVDAMLFCSLAQIGESDLLGLSLKDYERVKRGYFRMVEENEF
jgi:hypothetical protein